MLSVSLYIIVCSARNRMRKRLARLRQPRYLAGALAGIAYIYFSFFARGVQVQRATQARGRGGRQAAAVLNLGARLAIIGPAITGVGLLALSAVAWVLPFDSGLLDFSEAEVQMLVPAPVTRRQLLMYRLIRSQVGILFGAVVAALVFSTTSGYSRVRTALAMWVLILAMKVYFTAVTLVRARLASAEGRARRMLWAPVLLTAAAAAVLVRGLMAEFVGRPIAGFGDVLNRVRAVTTTGPARVWMWPFVALARPLFETAMVPYLMAMATSVAVLVALTVWALESHHALQDAVADVTARRAAASQSSRSAYRTGFVRWRLAPAGRPEPAFMWKAALQTFRVVDRRSLVRLLILVGTLVFMAVTVGRRNGIAAGLGTLTVIGALFTILMAPQILRVDLRQDLRHLEVLKTWPVKASAVIRGQLLWPGVFLSVMSWILIGLAVLLSATVAPGMFFSGVRVEWRLWASLAAVIAAPALVFGQLMIHNGVALLFPAWIQTGKQRSRGLDAMGQRLIMLGGTWLALAIMAVPGTLAGGLLWFAFQRFIGPAALVLAALVGTMILGIEVLLGSEALGPIYEKLDVLAVERADD